MPSDAPSRGKTRGFSLLEAVLSFAVLGIVLGATYTLSTRSMRHQINAQKDYEQTIMARALLDEYVLTYPAMPNSGVYKNVWQWRIVESPYRPSVPTSQDVFFEYVTVTARTSRIDAPSRSVELSTVVARRAPGT